MMWKMPALRMVSRAVVGQQVALAGHHGGADRAVVAADGVVNPQAPARCAPGRWPAKNRSRQPGGVGRRRDRLRRPSTLPTAPMRCEIGVAGEIIAAGQRGMGRRQQPRLDGRRNRRPRKRERRAWSGARDKASFAGASPSASVTRRQEARALARWIHLLDEARDLADEGALQNRRVDPRGAPAAGKLSRRQRRKPDEQGGQGRDAPRGIGRAPPNRTAAAPTIHSTGSVARDEIKDRAGAAAAGSQRKGRRRSHSSSTAAPKRRRKTASAAPGVQLVSPAPPKTLSVSRLASAPRAGTPCHCLFFLPLGPMLHERAAATPRPLRHNPARRIRFSRHVPIRRHAFRPLAHRLSAYRRRAHRSVQLAASPPARRQDAAAHRGHRPRALDGGGHRARSSTA